jgi:3-oxoacyl-[acyl-carrier-protein] synthase-3
MTNDDWAKLVDTSDEWIRSRTGVCERHLVSEGESTLTLALEAARNALEVARISPAQLDLIIVATVTPEYVFPATACLLQDQLGATHAAAFDLSAGCSGFIYGVALASDAIRAGTYQYALVIGAETLSRIMDWNDRATCVLFGDGAGAVVLSASEVPGGIMSSMLGCDGSGGDYLMLPAGGSHTPASPETVAQRLHYIKMNGREVFKFATRAMDRATRLVCQRVNVSLEDLALVVPHQANDRIIQSAARSLGLSDGVFLINLDRYGNTSSASIPIALCEALEAGRVQRHDYMALVGFGAGLTWGALLIQWETPIPTVRISWWRRLFNALYYRWAKVRSWMARLRRRVEGWQVQEGNGQNGSHISATPPQAASQSPGPQGQADSEPAGESATAVETVEPAPTSDS